MTLSTRAQGFQSPERFCVRKFLPSSKLHVLTEREGRLVMIRDLRNNASRTKTRSYPRPFSP